jgi:hypothetical protein
VRLAVEVDEVAADADRAADDDAGEEKQAAPHDETIVTIGGRREKSPGQGRLEPASTPIVSEAKGKEDGVLRRSTFGGVVVMTAVVVAFVAVILTLAFR